MNFKTDLRHYMILNGKIIHTFVLNNCLDLVILYRM